MSIHAMAERLRRHQERSSKLDLFEAIVAQAERNMVLAETKAVERDFTARRLITILRDQTQSKSVLAACNDWLAERT